MVVVVVVTDPEFEVSDTGFEEPVMGFKLFVASLETSPIDLDNPVLALVVLSTAVEVRPDEVNRVVEAGGTLPEAAVEVLCPAELVTTPEGFVASETLAVAGAAEAAAVLTYDEVLAVDNGVLVAVVLVADAEVLEVEVLGDAASVVLAAEVPEAIFKFSDEPLKTALSFGTPDEDLAVDSAVPLLIVLSLLVEVPGGGSRTFDSSADLTELVATLLITGDFVDGFEVPPAACFGTVPVGLIRSTAIFFTLAVVGLPAGPLACELAACFVGTDLS